MVKRSRTTKKGGSKSRTRIKSSRPVAKAPRRRTQPKAKPKSPAPSQVKAFAQSFLDLKNGQVRE